MDTQKAFPKGIIAANTLAFAAAFAAWILFGPSVRTLAEELGLSAVQAGWIKTIPILTGSVMRIPIGVITDRFGARRTFSGLLMLGALAVFAMSFASSAAAFVVGGLVLGMVGTTFVVGVQSVSSWSPPGRQGLALGIFGAGNVGTAFTTLAMPALLISLGWRPAFRLYAVLLVLTAAGYGATVRDAPGVGGRKTLKGLLAPAASARVWTYGLYYTASFGVFIAACLTLGDLYIDSYGVSMATAGWLVTGFTFTAGLSRIPGGALSDRFGARRMLLVSLPLIGVSFLPAIFGLSVAVVLVSTVLGGILMGAAMSATLRAIPTDFPDSVGAVGGLVGAIGGLGGFYLPLFGDWTATATGTPAHQLVPLVFTAVFAAFVALAIPASSTAPAPALEAR